MELDEYILLHRYEIERLIQKNRKVMKYQLDNFDEIRKNWRENRLRYKKV